MMCAVPVSLNACRSSRGQTGIHAEQDAGQQGGLRVEEEPVDVSKRGGFPGIYQAQEGCTALSRQQRYGGGRHVAADALAREVLAIVEVLIGWRRFEATAQADRIPVVKLLIGRDARQDKALHHHGPLTSIQLAGLQAQVGICITSIQRFNEAASHKHVVARVVVESDLACRLRRDTQLEAQRAKEHHGQGRQCEHEHLAPQCKIRPRCAQRNDGGRKPIGWVDAQRCKQRQHHPNQDVGMYRAGQKDACHPCQ